MTPEQLDSVKRAAAAYEAVLAGRTLAFTDPGFRTYSELTCAQVVFRNILLLAGVKPRQFVVVGGWAYTPSVAPESIVDKFEVVGMIEL